MMKSCVFQTFTHMQLREHRAQETNQGEITKDDAYFSVGKKNCSEFIKTINFYRKA